MLFFPLTTNTKVDLQDTGPVDLYSQCTYNTDLQFAVSMAEVSWYKGSSSSLSNVIPLFTSQVKVFIS